MPTAYWEPRLNRQKGDYLVVDRIHNWAYGDPGKFYGSTPCPNTEYMTVSSDGSVVLCCLDHEGVHHLGNIGERPLLEIFNSDKAKNLRQIHHAGLRPYHGDV
jgi:hypothetical protein